MALTATATKLTFVAISEESECSSLSDTTVIATTCNRPNILHVEPKQKLEEVSICLSQDMIEKKLEYPNTIIFTQSYQHCSSLYLRLVEHIQEND